MLPLSRKNESRKGVVHLTYIDGGRECVVVGNPGRSRRALWRSRRWHDYAALFDRLVAYAGSFRVNEALVIVEGQMRVHPSSVVDPQRRTSAGMLSGRGR